MKNYLKNNHNHTVKYTLNMANLLFLQFGKKITHYHK